jgi:hypothetical protein
MAGGLLNLYAEGQGNILINSNPTKSFWKAKYAKHTNFGKQNFRIDFEGQPSFRLAEESVFTFKMKQYADLLMDCFISVEMPNIWSPIMPPRQYLTADNEERTSEWVPYEFKWIDNLGAMMIKKISITCGNQTIQEYSGEYLLASVERDFQQDKKKLFERMIGHTPEMNDPANAGGHVNVYPNAFHVDNPLGCQPSIEGRTLSIPLGAWFTLKTQNAFPMASLRFNELKVSITFRPINELFRIRDITDHQNHYPYVAPNFKNEEMQFYRFMQTPPDVSLHPDMYTDKRGVWDPNVHLNCTYVFLSDEERDVFAKKEQTYLITQVIEKQFHDVNGSQKISTDSLGLVKSWMFFLRRSDAKLRNEWSNRTNWPYNYVPFDSVPAHETQSLYQWSESQSLPPSENVDGTPTNLFIQQIYSPQNKKEILLELGIAMDGHYRENVYMSDIFNYNQKYMQTTGNAPDGLYCYNFCLSTSPFDNHPSGAMNVTHFKNIEFEFSVIRPPLNPYAINSVVCDSTGTFIVAVPSTQSMYVYAFDLILMEERINMIKFIGGNAGLVYAT